MKKILITTTIVMLITSTLALLKEKQNNKYSMLKQINTQTYYLKQKEIEIEKHLNEEIITQNNYKEKNIEKINILEIWKKQVEKIKSYL